MLCTIVVVLNFRNMFCSFVSHVINLTSVNISLKEMMGRVELLKDLDKCIEGSLTWKASLRFAGKVLNSQNGQEESELELLQVTDHVSVFKRLYFSPSEYNVCSEFSGPN